MDEAKLRGWATRRQKYGPRGHGSSYSRPATGPCARCSAMEALLIKLYREGSASEGQVARATGLHRIEIRRRADEQEGGNG